MEVRSGKVTDATSGFVVRQFSPSRIERQVLAQVFELVCGQQREAGVADSRSLGTVPAHGVEAVQLTEAPVAGRRAA
jgi:hypothetical protein